MVKHMAKAIACKTYYINIAAHKKYPIVVGVTATLDTGDLGAAQRVLIVTTPTVLNACDGIIESMKQRWGRLVDVVTIDDSESAKTIDTVQMLITACLEHGLGRHDCLVALGGGVVGDITGFVAAIYLRGIAFFQMPTSLLAQVDAAMGGKTGVNHPRGKNLIGAFHQPKKTVINPQVLATLPPYHMAEGLFEIIKYGIIRDKPLFWYLESHIAAIRSFSYTDCPDVWHVLIEKSIQNKADVVSNDEKEAGDRETLNFGHTIGHALETLGGYGLLSHGRAVAWGMLIEATIALQLRVLPPTEYQRIQALIQAFNTDPFPPITIDETAFFNALSVDKKVREGQVRYVVPTGIGHTTIVQDVDRSAVMTAVKTVIGELI